ncbi:Methionyl-tRNA formyltransferase [Anaerohalosphaera lusitana]|uniref:Methionyl-tRNA formyltransferase n=1 Tax=Anaerohalosphaera lusitana TaxID=1936003 RepID=A0A1U9NRK3_9BACT|nr:methionyl-tRNA formyltransferase [Anaerohalosphaera lusitana]AQT70354.1 Methionyl-tRNA formyltransferase [Anaerohalosphaera lusitana]
MKITYFGSAEFGIPCLDAIKNSKHELAGIFTQPAHGAGRGRKPRPTHVAQWAERNGYECVEAENINRPEMVERVRACGGDLLVVIAFGQKIGPEVIEMHEKGAINVHASLLPKYRGAAPINWAIVNGETETGVSIITLADKMDAGYVLGEGKVAIDADDTAEDVHDKLAELSPGVLMDVIGQIEAGTAKYVEQDEDRVTIARKLKKSDGQVDFDRPAEQVRNMVRGFWPWPGAKADYVSAKTGKKDRVTLAQVRVVEDAGSDGEPGVIDDEFHVQCGAGKLDIVKLKPAGKRLMNWEAFCNGRHTQPGDKFVKIED